MLNGKDHKTVLTFLALDGNAAFTLLSLPCSIICPFDKYPLKRFLLFCRSIISHNVNLAIRFQINQTCMGSRQLSATMEQQIPQPEGRLISPHSHFRTCLAWQGRDKFCRMKNCNPFLLLRKRKMGWTRLEYGL